MKYLLLFLILIPVIFAGNMEILAVRESSNGLVGSDAYLSLEIQPGSGRVFMETSPLTKIDTQISTRVAQQVACSEIRIDCSNYDFIYTITSSSPLIGGPSAGSAISILTVSDLLKLSLKEDVTITGTIGSGGIIGPVGGIKQKIEIAASTGKKTILVPPGSLIMEDNVSINVQNFSESLGISVIEVSTLSEAIPYFLDYKYFDYELKEDLKYDSVMEELALDLCSKTNESVWLNYTKSGDYYTAASKCFSQNIVEGVEKFSNLSSFELKNKTFELYSNMSRFKKSLEEIQIISFGDLQTLMIVNERMREVEERINESNLAYAYERFNSAIAWTKFFKVYENRMVDVNLKTSCLTKLSQAQERVQYVSFLFPQVSIDLQPILNYVSSEDYPSCIYSSSLLKAKADSIISQSSSSNLTELIDVRLVVAEKVIAREQSRGNFPLAGYSYLQYAQSLRNETPSAALLYAHYAIELSDFDLYFPNKVHANLYQNYNLLIVYLVGIFSGIVILYMVKH